MIRLLGFCAPDERTTDTCLLYELADLGSVASNLSDHQRAALFTWTFRLAVLEDVAKALRHVNHHLPKCTLHHGSVSAANIVLADGMVPKLIGWDKANLREASTAGGQRSTTTKSQDRREVFTFGLTMVEVLTGCLRGGARPANLVVKYFGRGRAAGSSGSRPFNGDDFDKRVQAGPCAADLAAALAEVARKCVDSTSSRGSSSFQSTEAVCDALEPLSKVHRLVPAAAAAEMRRVQQQLRARVDQLHHDATAAEAARRELLRECNTCNDEFEVGRYGVECDGTTAHAMCADCFNSHVRVETTKPLADHMAREGEVMCFDGACDGKCFPARVIAELCSAELFDAYQNVKLKVNEVKIVKDQEESFQARLRRVEAMTAVELEVARRRRHVVENILTLKCPRCQQAFTDHSACMAVVCCSCPQRFCACCQAPAADASACHDHVKVCEFNLNPGSYFHDDFAATKKNRATILVNRYVATIADADLRARVVDAIRPHCDFDITPP